MEKIKKLVDLTWLCKSKLNLSKEITNDIQNMLYKELGNVETDGLKACLWKDPDEHVHGLLANRSIEKEMDAWLSKFYKSCTDRRKTNSLFNKKMTSVENRLLDPYLAAVYFYCTDNSDDREANTQLRFEKWLSEQPLSDLDVNACLNHVDQVLADLKRMKMEDAEGNKSCNKVVDDFFTDNDWYEFEWLDSDGNSHLILICGKPVGLNRFLRSIYNLYKLDSEMQDLYHRYNPFDCVDYIAIAAFFYCNSYDELSSKCREAYTFKEFFKWFFCELTQRRISQRFLSSKLDNPTPLRVEL